MAATSGTALEAASRTLGKYVLRCESGAELLFVDNETNPERWRTSGESDRGEAPFFFKDGINDYLVGGANGAINPEQRRDEGGRALRASDRARRATRPALAPDQRSRTKAPAPDDDAALGKPFAKVLELRRREADEFYATVIPESLSERSRPRHAPGAGGHAVEQAVLRL